LEELAAAAAGGVLHDLEACVHMVPSYSSGAA